ncbi:PREDICTED: uncharacterized protein LOC109170888 [Ipomoea nil]|uniref:uncharacterized protein LOC109170888 n=1 Tax=Ipomoea nil TaxID=35883 RepID=UPI0009011FAE|nr:PREDICTED: uncharacterized protein LOC109170888 [Ipomoea nil]
MHGRESGAKKVCREPITFTDKDLPSGQMPHRNALVIAMEVNGVVIRRVLVDTGSSVNILYLETFTKLSLTREQLASVKTSLAGFTGDSIESKGSIISPVEIGSYPDVRKLDMKFIVADLGTVQGSMLVDDYHRTINILLEQGDIHEEEAAHVLLGRPWQFDRKITFDGMMNTYLFHIDGVRYVLSPLTPKQVEEILLKSRKASKEAKSVPYSPYPKSKPPPPPISLSTPFSSQNPAKESPHQPSFLATKNDIKKAIRRGDTFNLLVIHKLTTDLDSSLVLHSESCFRNASIDELLADFSDLFPKEMPKGLPPLRGIEHQIDFVPGSTLPNRPAYKTNPVEAKEIQKQVEELLEIRHIRESLSPCAVSVLIVSKKDGTWRMCVDCPAINNITIKYRFPIPRLDNMLDELYGANKSQEKHLKHLRLVFLELRAAQLYVNLEKCSFMSESVEFLGFHVSIEGFYRKFVRDFSSIAAPMHELIKKDTIIKWGPKQEQAFAALKEKLTTAPNVMLLALELVLY